MDFLLIGGQPNTGKTETISRLTLKFISCNKFTISYGSITSSLKTRRINDFSIVLNGLNLLGKTVIILIHSATDDLNCITQLQKEITEHGPDIVICSIRDIGWERDMVLDIVSKNFSYEFPLARVTRRGTRFDYSLDWYRNYTDKVIDYVSSNTPFILNTCDPT